MDFPVFVDRAYQSWEVALYFPGSVDPSRLLVGSEFETGKKIQHLCAVYLVISFRYF